MAATVYGSGTWGITSEAAKGLYIGSMAVDASEEEVYVPNHIGEDIGLSMFNQQATITGSGAVVTADTTGQTLGGILDIASVAIFGTDTGITKFYVNSVNLTRANRDFETGSFTAVGRAGITAVSGTDVT